MTSKSLRSIPPRLARYPWYAPHQAWLKANGFQPSHAISRGTVAKRANLMKEDLCYADLSRSNLSYANLSRANLTYSNLSRSNLSHTNLSRAHLFSANFSYAHLFDVNFSHSDLSYVNFSDANLEGVDLTGAQGLDRLAAGDRLSQLLSGAWVCVPGPSR